MERVIDRFDRYMVFKSLNDNRVTIQIGFSVGLLGKARKEGRDLSRKAIDEILNYYIDLNRVWLLTGEGSMLTQDNNCSCPMCESEVPGDHTNSLENMTLELLVKQSTLLLSEIEELKKRISVLESDIKAADKNSA